MWTADREKFHYGLRQFVETILDRQGDYDYRTTEIAFHTGWLYEQDWYKRQVYARAREALSSADWTKELIGSGVIAADAFRAVGTRTEKQRNHMVNWRDVAFAQKCFKQNTKETEGLLYRLYKEDEDQASFEEALAMWGTAYPAISYLFFLKDRKKYMPMRPRLMESILERLGFVTECTKSCNWENYLEYMEILKWIQYELMKVFDDSAELIDAHTFLVRMADVEDVPPTEDSEDILNSSTFDTAVVTGSRGSRRKEYYVSRYEQMPQNREAALAAHGYRCAACGFDFSRVYGSLGRNFVEVHQVRPLQAADEEITIDPQKDLVCLCSNCHRMIHRSRNGIMSLEELKQWLLWGAAFDSTSEDAGL